MMCFSDVCELCVCREKKFKEEVEKYRMERPKIQQQFSDLKVHMFVCACFCASMCLCVCICMSVCLSVCVCIYEINSPSYLFSSLLYSGHCQRYLMRNGTVFQRLVMCGTRSSVMLHYDRTATHLYQTPSSNELPIQWHLTQA